MAKEEPWPLTGYIDPTGESALTGLAVDVGDEFASTDRDARSTEQVEALLQHFALSPHMRRKMHTLSGGEAVRCSIASATNQGVSRLLVDCAFEQLDAHWRTKILSFLAYWGVGGRTTAEIIDNRAEDLIGRTEGQVVHYKKHDVQNCTMYTELPGLTAVEAMDIQLHSLSFRYSQRTPYIFRGLNLRLESGTIYHLKGDNGSGKTTLLRLLSGTVVPQSGEIVVAGLRFNAQKRSRFTSLSFQNPDVQFTKTTVAGEIDRYWQLGDGATKLETRMLLEAGGLPPNVAELNPNECSYVIKKRLANLCAIGAPLPLIAFDEPTLGQDVTYVGGFTTVLKRLAALGRTVLLISHDSRIFDRLGDHKILVVGEETISEIAPARST